MLTTNNAYIKEYSLFDDMLENTDSFMADINKAFYEYENACRQIELKSFFENTSDSEYMFEAEKKSFVEKIGEKILELIEKISDFIKSIGERITGNIKKEKSYEETVTEILKEHPELRNDIINGINKEWYTVKDIAKLEKDIVGLTTLVKQKKIDNETLKEKVTSIFSNFHDSAAPITSSIKDINTLTSAFPTLVKNAEDGKRSLLKIKEAAADFQEAYRRNYEDYDNNVISSFLNALGQATGFATEECKVRVNAQEKSNNIFSKFINKLDRGARVNHMGKTHNKNLDKYEDEAARQLVKLRKGELTRDDYNKTLLSLQKKFKVENDVLKHDTI